MSELWAGASVLRMISFVDGAAGVASNTGGTVLLARLRNHLLAYHGMHASGAERRVEL